MPYKIIIYFKNGNVEEFNNSDWQYTANNIFIFTDVTKYIFSQDDIIKLDVKE